MNEQMKKHTTRLAWRLVIAASVFAVTASITAALERYEQSLQKIASNVKAIFRKVDSMKNATAETARTIDRIRQQLPSGYGSKSNEWLIYSKIDSLKATVDHSEMTVSTIEEKEGVLTLPFTFKPKSMDYSIILNQLGSMETSIFPLVSVNGIKIGSAAKDSDASGGIKVEGVITIPSGTGSGTQP